MKREWKGMGPRRGADRGETLAAARVGCAGRVIAGRSELNREGRGREGAGQ